jgi:mono/diheme cytochrome c family protein
MRGPGVALAACVLVGAACDAGVAIEDYPCPPGGTTLTYDNFGKPFLDGNCQTCHGAEATERDGAPSGYDFGTHADAVRWRARIFARAATTNTSMPPGPDDPPAEERELLAEWLACGAPP